MSDTLVQSTSTMEAIDPTPRPERRPRILYVASTRHSGGLEMASTRLAELLMRTHPARQEILYACRPGYYLDQQCRAIGIPSLPLTVRNSGDLSGVGRLIEIVRSERIDIIHVHSRRDYVTATLAVRNLRKAAAAGGPPAPKLLLHMHLIRALGSPRGLSGYFFAPNVDRFLAVSSAVRDYLLKTHRQLRPEQVAVVPNSVDVERFVLDREKGAAVRRSYGIPADACVIGMVGRLDAKGQWEAIEALGRLKRSDTYLMLVGDVTQRGFMTRLRKLIRRRGVSDRVVLCGPQPDIVAFLSAMDIFAHLPADEAFGLAPAEAMAAGLPVLVSNAGGCVELVEDGVTGLVTDPYNPASVRQKLLELITSPELRARLAPAGSAHVRARFTTEAQADVLTKIYDEVMQPAAAKT